MPSEFAALAVTQCACALSCAKPPPPGSPPGAPRTSHRACSRSVGPRDETHSSCPTQGGAPVPREAGRPHLQHDRPGGPPGAEAPPPATTGCPGPGGGGILRRPKAGEPRAEAQAAPPALTVSRCPPEPRSGSSWPPPARSQRSPLLPTLDPTADRPAAATYNRKTNAAAAWLRRPRAPGPARSPPPRSAPPRPTALGRRPFGCRLRPPVCRERAEPIRLSARPRPWLVSRDPSARPGCSAACWAGASRPCSLSPACSSGCGPSPCVTWMRISPPGPKSAGSIDCILFLRCSFRGAVII